MLIVEPIFTVKALHHVIVNQLCRVWFLAHTVNVIEGLIVNVVGV